MKTNNLFIGISIALFGSLIYVLMNFGIKFLSHSISTYFILLLQSTTGLICTIILLKRKSYPLKAVLKIPDVRYIFRSITSLASIFTLLYALQNVSVFNALVILNTAPLIMPFLRKILFKKNIYYSSCLAATIGFLGVILILSPDRSIFDAGIWLVLFSMLCMSLSLLILESMPSFDVNLMIFYYFFFSTLFLIILLITNFSTINVNFTYILAGLLIGIMFFIVQWTVVVSAQFISSHLIAILFYSEIILSLWLSIIFENTHLNTALIMGTILVIVAGIHAIIIEKNQARRIQYDFNAS